MKRLFTMIHKETLLVLRDRKAVLLLFFALLTSAATFLFYWIFQADSLQDIQTRVSSSRELFTLLVVSELLAFALCTPLLAAGTVTIERERSTLDLLYCTGLKPLHILLGKWSAIVAFILLLLIALLPVEALVFTLGGVDFDEYLAAALVTTVTVFTYGMFGLYLSTRFRRSTMATVAALGILVLWNCAHPFLLILYFDKANISPRQAGAWVALASGSPFVSIAMPYLVSKNGLGASATRWAYEAFLGFHGLVFVLSTFGAWMGLMRREGKAYSAARMNALRKANSESNQSTTSTAARAPSVFARVNSRLARTVALGNPVFSREFIFGAAGRGKALLLLVVLAQLLSLLTLTISRAELRNSGAQIAAVLALVACVLLLPAWVATSITTEHEEKTWDLLRVTPLSERQIVWGKLASYAKAVCIIAFTVSYLPFFRGLSAQSDNSSYLQVWSQLIVPLAGFVFFFGALMIYCSSRSRTNASALITCYMVILLLNAATMWIAGDPPSFHWMNDDLQLGLLTLFCPLIFLADYGSSHWRHYSEAIHFALLTIMGILLLWRAEARLRKNRRLEAAA